MNVDDLDKDSFDIFRREAFRSKRMTKADLKMSNEELLDSLGLVTENGLKRAAILLFHRNPEKWVIGCYKNWKVWSWFRFAISGRSAWLIVSAG